MGNHQSTTTKTNISNDIKISIENVVTTNITNAGTCINVADSDQDMVFGTCAEVNCDNIDFSINAEKTLKCMSENKNDISITITNDVCTSIENAIDKAIEASQKGIAVGADNTVTDETEIHNQIEENISNTIETTIINTFDSIISSSADQGFVFNGKMNGENCKVSLSSIVEQISETINETVITLLVGNTSINDILTKYDLTMKANQEGFDFNKFFSDILDGINNFFDGIFENLPGGAIKEWLAKLFPIAVAVCVAVVVIVIGGIFAKQLTKPKEDIDKEF
jgi:hypothetical protein